MHAIFITVEFVCDRLYGEIFITKHLNEDETMLTAIDLYNFRSPFLSVKYDDNLHRNEKKSRNNNKTLKPMKYTHKPNHSTLVINFYQYAIFLPESLFLLVPIIVSNSDYIKINIYFCYSHIVKTRECTWMIASSLSL